MTVGATIIKPGDGILANWNGIIDNDFAKTISQTFDLPPPEHDNYTYRADNFAMTMAEIHEQLRSGKLRYKYMAHGEQIEVPTADIEAYTSIFSSNTDTTKALNSFAANAKRQSPRATVAHYLQSKRIPPQIKVPKSKAHLNPAYDIWSHACQQIAFLGPLPDPSYANPAAARRSHPILPVLYHHFGCAVPTYEALNIINNVVKEVGAGGVIDLGSGNGYWSYMLRKMGIKTTAVDNMTSEYRTMWIQDSKKADGVEFLMQSRTKAKDHDVLLMVYPVVAGNLTSMAIKAYKGDAVVIVGTQNTNRFTGFSDCTAEEWFKKEMPSWELNCRIAMPSFAGKDDAMFVWKRTQ